MDDNTQSNMAAVNFKRKLVQLYERFSYVQKTGKNQHFRYKFMEEAELKGRLNQACRDLGMVIRDVHTTLLSSTPKTADDMATATAHVRLVLADVDSDESVMWEGVGGGSDSGDKAEVKAMVAATKYAIATGCMVKTGNDPEADPSVDEAAIDSLKSRIRLAQQASTLHGLKSELMQYKGAAQFDELKRAFKQRMAEVGEEKKS